MPFRILVGFEQTLMAQWTCPVDNTAYLTSYYAATSTNKVSDIQLYVRPFGGVFNVKHVVLVNLGHIHHVFDFPLAIEAKSDVRVMGAAVGGGGIISAGFDLWFET